MKKFSAILSGQWKLSIAGSGIYFITALLCSGAAFPRGETALFAAFSNEFGSLLRLSSLILFFLLGHRLAAPRKQESFGRSAVAALVYLLLIAPVMLVFPFHSTPLSYPVMVPLCCAAGLFAGEIRQYLLRQNEYCLYCIAGAGAGVWLAWLLRLHPEWMPPERLLNVLLVLLFWVILRRIQHWRIGRGSRIAFMLLWGMFILIPYYHFSPSVRGTGTVRADDRDQRIYPALVSVAGLQANSKSLKIMAISDNLQWTESLSVFPLTRKLVSISLKNSVELYRQLAAESEEFDLIVLSPPLPESLYAEHFYSIPFLRQLRQLLSADGVLAMEIPVCRRNRFSELYGTAGATLRKIFPSVKPSGTDFLLLCGGSGVTNSPAELNRRAEELGLMPDYLPEGVFWMMSTPEEQAENERKFRQETDRCQLLTEGRGGELMWHTLRGVPLLDRSCLGTITDRLRRNLLTGIAVLFGLLLIIRYFYSGEKRSKQCWMSLENGLYVGLTAVLLLVPYQLQTGRLPQDWLLGAGIFLTAEFAGRLASIGRHHSPLLLKLLLGVSLLVPAVGSVLANMRPEPLLYLALIGYVGYTSGAIAADLRAELTVLLTGLIAGLLLGAVFCWLPGGLSAAVIVAVLTRISPVAAENLQKQFEKTFSWR